MHFEIIKKLVLEQCNHGKKLSYTNKDIAHIAKIANYFKNTGWFSIICSR